MIANEYPVALRSVGLNIVKIVVDITVATELYLWPVLTLH